MIEERRVVITGIGPLTSVGIGKEAFWKGLLERKTGIRLEECFIDGELWDRFYLHKVDNFDISKFGIDKGILEEIKFWKKGEDIIDLFYLMAVVKLALNDSGLRYNLEDNEIGLVLTHENPGSEQFFSKVLNESFEALKGQSRKASAMTKKQFFQKLYGSGDKAAYDLQTFMFLYHITKAFSIHGYSLFINNACASGLYALEAASQMIRCGRNPAVIVAAADHPGIYKYLWFKQIDMYAEDGKTKPFAKNRNGFVFGDGGVGLLLEDLDHARKRKANIYAEYLGGGFSLEGWKITLPAVGSNYYRKAIKQAFRQANIEPKDIDLVCAHGAGTSLVDRYEADAITDVFGPNPKKPLITAFKGYIGHNLGGSALLESAIILLCLNNNLVLPTLNCDEVDPKLRINLVREKTDVEISTAIKICCAFAGYNGAAVFKKFRGRQWD